MSALRLDKIPVELYSRIFFIHGLYKEPGNDNQRTTTCKDFVYVCVRDRV